jgi:hypothetical protein
MPDLLIPLLQDIFLSFATVTQKIILLTTAKQKYLVQKWNWMITNENYLTYSVSLQIFWTLYFN